MNLPRIRQVARLVESAAEQALEQLDHAEARRRAAGEGASVNSRLENGFVIRTGPAPAAKGRGGRAGPLSPLYRAAEKMRPGEHLIVPESERLTIGKRRTKVWCIRCWMRKNDLFDQLTCYQTTDHQIVIAHREGNEHLRQALPAHWRSGRSAVA